ncbi:hypothetical protein EDD17DRAFT_1549480 [Pisolithus thermaeus]|nr:hypothetical protein EDD17DRAFT_1549480 [Pisolithus thermaeus]
MVAIDGSLAIAGMVFCWLVSGTEHPIRMPPQLLICLHQSHRCLKFLDLATANPWPVILLRDNPESYVRRL